ncbi:Hypothetical protein, putative [Bodo saltans]|uniref:Uncharacterized protein n=1 Tax=Bodo saltans TaxID=75058 RepID=A0A0S4IJ66_BODSA|nr:Hypothetical protein, putative [Bodo saltans]|eukprot:CUE75801.1 Hypothetical protein, putative [Bodo saltans]
MNRSQRMLCKLVEFDTNGTEAANAIAKHLVRHGWASQIDTTTADASGEGTQLPMSLVHPYCAAVEVAGASGSAALSMMSNKTAFSLGTNGGGSNRISAGLLGLSGLFYGGTMDWKTPGPDRKNPMFTAENTNPAVPFLPTCKGRGPKGDALEILDPTFNPYSILAEVWGTPSVTIPVDVGSTPDSEGVGHGAIFVAAHQSSTRLQEGNERHRHSRGCTEDASRDDARC